MMAQDFTQLRFEKASKAHGTAERVFELILINSTELQARSENQRPVMLEAMVLANGLCVCVLPRTLKMEEMNPIRILSFMEPPNPKEGRGSTKKKAKVLNKTVICSVVHEDGLTTTLHSPITGHVLEWNQRLTENFAQLLGTLEGYVAVIQPDDKTGRVINAQN